MQFLNDFHPERNIDGFTKNDGTIKFYLFVQAAILRSESKRVLDFGAGRGEWFCKGLETGFLRRQFRDLRTHATHVTACDVDPVVLSHPASHSQVQIDPTQPLPFGDGEFDVVVSDWTFEHIPDPVFTARELARVLKSGGYLCARTPNATGYLRLCSQLIPNRFHVRVLRNVQPDREEQDVFPTVYRMNSMRAIRRLFPDFDHYSIYDCSDPAYYFGRKSVYWLMSHIHKLLPEFMAPLIYFYLRKKS